MSELRVTTCDRCNPDGRLDTRNGRGNARMAADEACRLGWAREPGGHIDGSDDTHYCPDCIDDETAT